MHVYSKKDVDFSFTKAVYCIPEVRLALLSKEDIAQYKNDFKDSRFKPNLLQNTVPLVRPIPKKNKIRRKRKDILKLVLSREGETDKFKSKFKSSHSVQKDKNQSPTATSTVVSSDLEKMEEVNDENKLDDNLNDENKSDEKVCDENVCKENTESTNLPNSLVGKIKIRDPSTMMDESTFKKFTMLFFENNINNPLSDNILKNVPPNSISNTLSLQRVKLSLSEIENLYVKYFSKTIQDTIVVIASILNIISISNIHHKARMDESFKKRSEAEKLKERVDANRMHARHKKVLEMKLKKHFTDVVSSFDDSEFEHAFQMFFLSILTVLRVLDPPKFKKGSIFKNLVLLLWNSLKSSEYDHSKVFGMFRDKKFRPACIDLISLIEDSRDIDPRITDRMAIFFLSAVNDREYFQAVINAVTGDSNEDLGLLIDNAASQCYINSKFKDPVNNNSFIPSTINSTAIINQNDDKIRWVIAKGLNGSYQPIPVSSDSRPPKTAKITIDPSKAGRQINSFYENFSSSVFTPTTPTESFVPKAIAPKLNGVTTTTLANQTVAPKLNVVATPTLANNSMASKLNVTSSNLNNSFNNGSLSQAATLMSFKTAIQNLKPIPTTTIQKTDGNTIFVGNKQFQLIRGPIRAVPQNTNNVVFKTPNPPKPPVVSDVFCCAKNCNAKATIMCSTCTSVKYCSHICQRRDWYSSHINNCQKLKMLQQK